MRQRLQPDGAGRLEHADLSGYADSDRHSHADAARMSEPLRMVRAPG
jgi:hypothetical protein